MSGEGTLEIIYFSVKEKEIMKKRRTIIISLLLVAALVLGVGYAEMTRMLTINGDAILNQNNDSFVVEFTDKSITADKGSVTINGTSADFNIENIADIGDKAVITLTVTNNSPANDLKAELISMTPANYTLTYEDGSTVDESSGKFFTISYEIKNNLTQTVWNSASGKLGDGLTLAKGESATVEITVEIARTIKSKVNLSGVDFTLDFEARS